MNKIILPNILLNPAYVSGLEQPLEDVAEILDAQDRPSYAKALREAAQICKAFAAVNLEQSAVLVKLAHP